MAFKWALDPNALVFTPNAIQDSNYFTPGEVIRLGGELYTNIDHVAWGFPDGMVAFRNGVATLFCPVKRTEGEPEDIHVAVASALNGRVDCLEWLYH